MDGEAKTVWISDAISKEIVAEIRKILNKKCVQLKCYRRIVGKLRHVAITLPDMKGIVLPINNELKGNLVIIGLEKIREVRSALIDLAAMVKFQKNWPTPVKELIPNEDH